MTAGIASTRTCRAAHADWVASVEEGNRLLRAGQHRAAVRTYESVLNVIETPETLYNLALAKYHLRDYHSAIQHCLRCQQLETKRADVLVLLGNLYNVVNQPLQACVAYQDALVVAPDDGEILYNLACTQDRMGDVDAAIENYRHARRANPNIPDTNLQKALAKRQALRARGKSKEAPE